MFWSRPEYRVILTGKLCNTNLREGDPSMPGVLLLVGLRVGGRHRQSHADEAREEDETNLEYY